MDQLFVIKNVKTKKFIAIDAESGGYPYEVDKPHKARIWNNTTDPHLYQKTFKNPDWELNIFNWSIIHMNWPPK